MNSKNVKVWKYVVNKEITINDYKNCLFSGRQQLRPMNVIRSHHHEVFTEQVNKIALSADDDKRIILPDRIHTLAPGFQGWGQTERPKENRGTLGKTRGPGVENSCAIFGKTEGPWERIGSWGGEFLCNFGHRWEDGIINKQRKEVDPSIPSSYLLIQFFLYETRLCRCNAISEIPYSRLKKIIETAEFWPTKKHLISCWSKLLSKNCCWHVGVYWGKKNIKEDWLACQNFHTGFSCFTLVLRCYTRDTLSFIHLCCSRRYT